MSSNDGITSTVPGGGELPAPRSRAGELFGRRRRFLVHRGYQIRVGMLAAGMALVLLILLNIGFFYTNQQSRSAILAVAPELRMLIEGQDRLQTQLIMLSSLVFVVGVFLVGILESHKTAGAAYQIARCMERVGEGELQVGVRLRRGDNLRDLESAFNRMAEGLRLAASQEKAILEKAIGRTDGSSSPELRHMAADLEPLLRALHRRLG